MLESNCCCVFFLYGHQNTEWSRSCIINIIDITIKNHSVELWSAMRPLSKRAEWVSEGAGRGYYVKKNSGRVIVGSGRA